MATLSPTATAIRYSPVSGLITDNNSGAFLRNSGVGGARTGGIAVAEGQGRDTPGAGGGLGGAYSPPDFSNPNAPNPSAPGLPPGVAGSISGAGAYTPDWASLIQNDAGLKDAAAALAAGGAQNQAQLEAQIANAYEQFGGLPSGVDIAQLAQQLGMSQSDLQNYLGSDVQKLAQQNNDAGLSTEARLQQANDQATRALIANLNKRGILHSGEASYQLDQQNKSFKQAQFDAYQKFLGFLQQYQQGYLSAQNANSQALANAYNAAGDRVYNNNQGSAGSTAQFDHIDANGNAVYKDGNGNFFNADGSAYSAPQAPPPAPTLPNPSYGTAPRNGVGIM